MGRGRGKGTFCPERARRSRSAERYSMSSLFLTGSPFEFLQPLAIQPGSQVWKPA